MDYMERFTERAQEALAFAQDSAKELGHNYVGSEHLLIGLMRETDGAAAKAIAFQGVTQSAVSARAEELVGRGDYHFTNSFGYTPRTKKILENSLYEAKNLKNNYIGTEHILLAILREQNCVAVRILTELGADLKALSAMLTGSNQKEAIAIAESYSENTVETPVLDQFGKDLTRSALGGDLDPVIGREAEIQRIIQILSRRTKNNPILIGEPGVGKSAIIEGLAQRIVSGNIPDLLLHKRVISLDLGSMLAGTKFRGEFEERLKNAINELIESKNVVLFIDEVHTIIGAGASEGSIDASNILKPALARGEIQVVGATTIDEYRRYLEKDAALERRFQPVVVGEPSTDEAKAILFGLRDRYEAHHKVRITDEAVTSAVDLSSRYIADRFLPDKAIDLMDEAASHVKLAAFVLPPDIQKLDSKLEALLKDKEEAVNNQNFERAASIRDEEMNIRNRIKDIRSDWDKQCNDNEPSVTANDIADVVNAWTGIPVSQLTQDESERLLHLEDRLRKRVIGQNAAVSAVARAIRRARAGLKDPRRPIGSFIFLGPTGVGKTELAKALAEAMFSDEDALLRFDMSEYMESYSTSKLIGSPPGYIGYDDGGQLTDRVRRRPYSVILFDEIEKAHPDVFNILLQVLDDGRLTDSRGTVVNFSNTIIIMTSNLGASNFGKASVGFGAQNLASQDEKLRRDISNELKSVMKPEFINRIDELVFFDPLQEDCAQAIVGLMLNRLTDRLAENGLHIAFSKDAVAYIAKNGFDPVYGARPLRRLIQTQVEDMLSEEIISGRIGRTDDVTAEIKDGNLSFNKDK